MTTVTIQLQHYYGNRVVKIKVIM